MRCAKLSGRSYFTLPLFKAMTIRTCAVRGRVKYDRPLSFAHRISGQENQNLVYGLNPHPASQNIPGRLTYSTSIHYVQNELDKSRNKGTNKSPECTLKREHFHESLIKTISPYNLLLIYYYSINK